MNELTLISFKFYKSLLLVCLVARWIALATYFVVKLRHPSSFCAIETRQLLRGQTCNTVYRFTAYALVHLLSRSQIYSRQYERFSEKCWRVTWKVFQPLGLEKQIMDGQNCVTVWVQYSICKQVILLIFNVV